MIHPSGNREISAIAYDITERKKIDRRIREALKEKEILLQEVHHRVKNNLQIIHSILNLQKKFVDDDKAIVGLEEIQNRVSTMSIIHETLYQNTDVSRIGVSQLHHQDRREHHSGVSKRNQSRAGDGA